MTEDELKAQKHDDGRPPLGWLPRTAVVQVSQVLAYGARKYSRHQWRKGMEWQRLIDASLRHIYAFSDGEDIDPESGLPHLAHAACCLSFLMEYTTTHPEFDDRYKKEVDHPANTCSPNKI